MHKRLGTTDSQAKEQGGRVAVTRLWRRGAIDYKRVPELASIDLEQYRAVGREAVRVTVGLRGAAAGDGWARYLQFPWDTHRTLGHNPRRQLAINNSTC